MQYSYDTNKKALNLTKHGFDFDDAKLVIESKKQSVLKTTVLIMMSNALLQ